MKHKNGVLKRLFAYMAKDKWMFVLGVTLTLFFAVINILPPFLGQLMMALTGKGSLSLLEKIPFLHDLIAEGVDQRALAENILLRKEVNTRQFIFIMIAFVVFIIGRVTLDYFRNFIMTYLSHKTSMRIRGDMLLRLMFAPLRFFRQNKEGELISKIQNDTVWLENYIYSTVPSLVADPLMFLLTLTVLIILSWKLTLVSLLLAPILAFIIARIGKAVATLITRVQSKMGDYTAIMQELLYGIEVVKIFSQEKAQHKAFEAASDRFLKEDKKLLLVAAASRPSVEFFTLIAALSILGYGGYLVINNEMPFDYFWGYILYLLNVAQPINNISNIYVNTQRTIAAGERVFDLMDIAPETEGEETLPLLTDVKGTVAFNDVTFRYEGKNDFTLGPISLTVNPGEVVAFVGMSGGGKTTLVNMIPKLVTPKSGTVTIDGTNIHDVQTASVRRHLGMVAQENILFFGSIKENIRYGKPDATDDEVYEAARIAHADEFIMQLPDGYDTEIAERGATLSGGQRQRIALARAVIRQPKILILDEATSALDTESEQHIQNALLEIIHRQTTFIIAHRLSTVKHANRIFVVEDGRITEAGTHDELIALDGKYRHLYSLQFR